MRWGAEVTYSIIGRDGRTGEIGVAVASRFFACGALVPHVGPRTAVATQAFVNPLWGVEGLRRLEAGEMAGEVLADFVARDGGQAIRQCHMMDATGRIAAHTGADCVDWAGHRTGGDHSVAGNMLVGQAVIDATFETFADRNDLDLPHRLLAAMRAGEAAGGDRRGRQAAGLKVHRGQAYAHLDLRVDDHGDPLSELDRLLDVAAERYLHLVDALPTEEDFSGATDRAPIDAAIVADERRRREAGRASRSLARPGGV